MIVANVKPGTVPKNAATYEPSSATKKEAFLNLIDQLDEILPEPVIMDVEMEGDNGNNNYNVYYSFIFLCFQNRSKKMISKKSS